MTEPTTVASDYLALWNDDDDDSRRERLARGWAPDARYADPLMAAEGRAGIADMIAGARQQFPGHVFKLTGTPDGHGSFARFSWTLAPPGGVPVVAGTDVARLDEVGRISEVTGFLDGVPA